MNITLFNNAIYSIESKFELTCFKLEYDNHFPKKIRFQFQEALNQLLKLLKEDINHQKTFVPAWHTACRIVKLKKIHTKIEKIRGKILKTCKRPYFSARIQFKVLPLLVNRVKELRKFIGSTGRLPFAKGAERKNFHLQVKENLKVQDVNKIEQIEKEYFHLLGDHLNTQKLKTVKEESFHLLSSHLDPEKIKIVEREYFHLLGDHLDTQKLKTVDIQTYSGNLEIYSLESWIEILNLFIEEGNGLEKKKGRFLLNVIQKSVPFSLKTSFAYNLFQTPNYLGTQKEISYFEDLIELHKHDVLNIEKNFAFSSFLEKYTLAKSCSIPKRVVINEMAWDMLDEISQMREREYRLFVLGIRSHSIAVQISCIKPALDIEKGNYQYKILNTGLGIENHKVEGVYAYPLIFKKLPITAFSYSFVTQLIQLCLEEKNIKAFYQLHDKVLVEEFDGKKEFNSGKPYLLQIYGICSYSVIRSWINSFLSEKQSKHLEILKAKISISKQEKVVRLLQEDVQASKEWKISKKKRNIRNVRNDLVFTAKKKKLNESKILLELGQKYLEQVTKIYH